MRALLVPALAATLLVQAAESGPPPTGGESATGGASASAPCPADEALAQRVRLALQQEPSLSTAGRAVAVSARHGGVTLSGTIPEAEHRAVRLCVANVAGVRSVQDALVIHPIEAPAASRSAPGAEQRQGRSVLDDEELRRRVEQALSGVEAGGDDDSLAITARDGVVWVDSRVWKPEDRARLIAMVGTIPGVRRVEDAIVPEKPQEVAGLSARPDPVASDATHPDGDTTARFDREATDDKPRRADAPVPRPP